MLSGGMFGGFSVERVHTAQYSLESFHLVLSVADHPQLLSIESCHLYHASIYIKHFYEVNVCKGKCWYLDGAVENELDHSP